MLIVAGEWTGATLNSEVNLLMQRKPFWFVLGFGLLCAESSMERDWPHVRPPQRPKRRKAWGGFLCDRWKRNPGQLEISGGFDVDTLSASDSVLAWDPVAEIWNGVGHLAEPRSKSPAFLSTKVLRYWHAITTVQLKDVCPGNPQLKQSRSTSAPLQKVSS